MSSRAVSVEQQDSLPEIKKSLLVSSYLQPSKVEELISEAEYSYVIFQHLLVWMVETNEQERVELIHDILFMMNMTDKFESTEITVRDTSTDVTQISPRGWPRRKSA